MSYFPPVEVQNDPILPVRSAPHLRGRVYLTYTTTPDAKTWNGYRRRLCWYYAVHNCHTGRDITSDGPFYDLGRAIDTARLATAAARLAWVYGFTQKNLRG